MDAIVTALGAVISTITDSLQALVDGLLQWVEDFYQSLIDFLSWLLCELIDLVHYIAATAWGYLSPAVDELTGALTAWESQLVLIEANAILAQGFGLLYWMLGTTNVVLIATCVASYLVAWAIVTVYTWIKKLPFL